MEGMILLARSDQNPPLKKDPSLASSLRKIAEIVQEDLCVRCGACVAICPTDALAVGRKSYPYSPDPQRCTDCQLCVKVCPGHEVDFPRLTEKVFRLAYDSTLPHGFFKAAYVGHASDTSIRERGSSGGVATQLLIYLLEKGEINGAIVVVMDQETPWKAKAMVARTKEDILQGAQSKYVVVAVNEALREIKRDQGTFALVGLPCHLHAFRKLEEINRSWSRRIPITIGLYCHMTLEEEATLDLAEIAGVSLGQIKHLEYRGGPWPGGVKAKLKNREYKSLHYADIRNGAYNYLHRIYYPQRCLYCLDAACELADISLADPWINSDQGGWKYPGGWSVILERTERGSKLLFQASHEEAIVLKKIPAEELSHHADMALAKKRRALVKLYQLKEKGKSFPDYHLDIPKLPLRDRLREYLASWLMIFGKSRLTQKVAARILFSGPGTLLTKLKIFWRKTRKKGRGTT